MSTEIVSLTDMATQINFAHEACVSDMRNALSKAIEVGRLLTEAKESPDMKHGQWIPWIKTNCSFHVGTAWRYMQAYDNREILRGAQNLDSVRGLLKSLPGKREKKEPTEPEPWTTFDGMEKLHESVVKILDRWPQDELAVLGERLMSMGQEILERGELH